MIPFWCEHNVIVGWYWLLWSLVCREIHLGREFCCSKPSKLLSMTVTSWRSWLLDIPLNMCSWSSIQIISWRTCKSLTEPHNSFISICSSNNLTSYKSSQSLSPPMKFSPSIIVTVSSNSASDISAVKSSRNDIVSEWLLVQLTKNLVALSKMVLQNTSFASWILHDLSPTQLLLQENAQFVGEQFEENC